MTSGKQVSAHRARDFASGLTFGGEPEARCVSTVHSTRHATPRHATPRHAMPRLATPHHATPHCTTSLPTAAPRPSDDHKPWEPIGHRKKSIKNLAHNSTLAALAPDNNGSNASNGSNGGGGGGADPYANRVDPTSGQATSQRLSPSKSQALKAMGLGNNHATGVTRSATTPPQPTALTARLTTPNGSPHSISRWSRPGWGHGHACRSRPR